MEIPDDPLYEEDRLFLRKILDECSNNEKIKMYVNPSVQMEINATKDDIRRRELQKIFSTYEFIEFNKSIFPVSFPVTFLSEREEKILEDLCNRHPGLKKDKKIIADAGFCQKIDVLLTTDRRHLANIGVNIKGLKIFTPKELFEYTN